MALSEGVIDYPKRLSEVEIQTALRVELVKHGLDARLEVCAKLGDKRHKIDIVVFRDRIPQAIIECKSWSKRYYKERRYQGSYETYQIRKYRRWGLPVFVCGREEEIPQVTDEILSSYNEHFFEPVNHT